MPNLSIVPELIPVGSLDPETYEMIHLINSFDMPANFFRWLSSGDFTAKVIAEEILTGKYKRIVQYHIQDSLVLTGNGEFDLNRLPKEAIQKLTAGVTPISRELPGFENLQRRIMTQISTELHYTVVAHLYMKEELVGFSWEIYELKKLIELYEHMNDPLRYWRKNNDY
jgi:hypothetical protein